MRPTRIQCWKCDWPDSYLWYCTCRGAGIVEWHCFRCGNIVAPADMAQILRERGVGIDTDAGGVTVYARAYHREREGERDGEMRERLAAYAHEAWAGWMKYQFEKGVMSPDGMYLMIPLWAVERWMRQQNTLYAELPEAEKESDRKEADRILAILRTRAVLAVADGEVKP